MFYESIFDDSAWEKCRRGGDFTILCDFLTHVDAANRVLKKRRKKKKMKIIHREVPNIFKFNPNTSIS